MLATQAFRVAPCFTNPWLLCITYGLGIVHRETECDTRLAFPVPGQGLVRTSSPEARIVPPRLGGPQIRGVQPISITTGCQLYYPVLKPQRGTEPTKKDVCIVLLLGIILVFK
jgi:hypothetical protein